MATTRTHQDNTVNEPPQNNSITDKLTTAWLQHRQQIVAIGLAAFGYAKAGVIPFVFVLFAFLAVPTVNNARFLVLPEGPESVGPLVPNTALTVGERLYEGELHGPESFIIDGDHLFTTGSKGNLIDVYKGTERTVARVGPGPCGGFFEETTCGRVLGMRMDREGRIVFIDTYFGLFRVDKNTGELETLYKSSTPIEGQTAALLNDLDIADDGKIYFTDSHDTFHRNQFLKVIFEMRACGRLLVYDPQTKKTTKVLDGLVFPNGVQITSDKKAILIAETIAFRIKRYDLKTKTLSTFIENMPGTIDNIRYSKETGTYWMGMAAPRSKETPSGLDKLAKSPFVRKFLLARVMTIDIMDMMYRKYRKSSGNSYGLVSEVDEKGQLVGVYRDPEGEVVEVASEVQVFNGTVYISSVISNFFVRVDLKKLRAALSD